MKPGKTFYVRVQWAGRRDSVDVCSHRVCKTLEIFHNLLGQEVRWRQSLVNKSFKAKPKPVRVSTEADIASCLAEGKSYKDDPRGEAIPELGTHLILLNEDETLEINCHCGAFGPRVANDLCIRMSQDWADRLTNQNLVNLFQQLIMIWRAPFGTIYCDGGIMSDWLMVIARYVVSGATIPPAFTEGGELIGDWQGGKLWAIDEFARFFSAWPVTPPKKRALLGIVIDWFK